MTSQQELAFTAGSGATPDAVLFTVSATVAVCTLTWVVSVVFGSYLMWREDQLELVDLIANALRGSVVLLVFGFYFN